MTNGVLLYSWIGDYLGCHQRPFIQSSMETDVETDSQTLGLAQGILLNREGKDCTSHRVQDIAIESTETTYLGIQELAESESRTREHALDGPRPLTYI